MPLYATKKYNNLADLRAILNGTAVAGSQATNGTNTAGSPNLGVPVVTGVDGPFANAEVGDRVIIAGESIATVFLIGTVTDAENVILDNNIVNANVGVAVFRVVKSDAIPIADIKLNSPVPNPNQENAGFVIYELS